MRWRRSSSPGGPPAGTVESASTPAVPALALRRGAFRFFADAFAAGAFFVAIATTLKAPGTDVAGNLDVRAQLFYDFGVRTFAAEFPNDNPDLHDGTIWMSESPCGALIAYAPSPAPIPAVPPIEVRAAID